MTRQNVFTEKMEFLANRTILRMITVIPPL